MCCAGEAGATIPHDGVKGVGMVAPAGLSARTPGCFDDRLKIGIAGLEPDEAAGQRWIGQEGRGSPCCRSTHSTGTRMPPRTAVRHTPGGGVRKPPTRKPRTAPRSATGGQRREKAAALVGLLASLRRTDVRPFLARRRARPTDWQALRRAADLTERQRK